MLEIIIPFKTPSVNHLYGHHGFRKYLKPEAKELRDKITQIVKGKSKPKGEFLKVTVEIHENWYNKDGTIKKKDVSNREKFLIDSIFDALDIDDKHIFRHTMIKRQSDTAEFAVVRIE